jgi:hypothetical protein
VWEPSPRPYPAGQRTDREPGQGLLVTAAPVGAVNGVFDVRAAPRVEGIGDLAKRAAEEIDAPWCRSGARTAAITRSPAATAASTVARPRPREAPVTRPSPHHLIQGGNYQPSPCLPNPGRLWL